MGAGIAFAVHIEHHTFLDAGGNVDFHNLIALDNASAVAGLALVLDDGAFAVAGGALGLGGHDAEHRPHRPAHHTAAMTCGAGLGLCATFGAGAFALFAGHILAHLEALGHTAGDVLQRELHLQPQVAATVDALAVLLAAAESAESAEAAVTAEDVAEHAEDVVHIHAATAESAEAALRTVESELVVLTALVGVVQHLIGLGSLLKLLFGLLVARVAVGVVFDGELAVSLLYLVF